MGSGGYAAISNKAVLAAQKAAQQKAVEKAAFGPDCGFDASTLHDLQLAPIDEVFSTSGGFFDLDAPLDPTLWDNSSDVPPFGSLAVDALFMPSSPLKTEAGISPLSSPLRAPGSPAAPTAQQAPMLPEPAPAAAPAIPLVHSVPVVPILSSYASSGDQDVVVVFTPRVPKRPASEEPDVDGRMHKRTDAEDDSSEESDCTTASLQQHDMLPQLVAAALDTPEQVEAALPGMPTSQKTPSGELVTLNPTLWRDARRDASPPFRIHVNAGLHTMRAPGVEAPITLFGSIHPRIVTTGQPHRRLGRPGLHRLVPAPPVTRATRAHGSAERAHSVDLAPVMRREKTAEREACTLEEVWLLKRSLQRGQSQVVLDAYQSSGPFEGTTLPDAPAWTGNFAVDLVARVAEPSGGTFWIKACNRRVQELD